MFSPARNVQKQYCKTNSSMFTSLPNLQRSKTLLGHAYFARIHEQSSSILVSSSPLARFENNAIPEHYGSISTPPPPTFERFEDDIRIRIPYLNSRAKRQYCHVFSAHRAIEYRHSYFTQSPLIHKVEQQTISPCFYFHQQHSKTGINTCIDPSLLIHRVKQQNITFSLPPPPPQNIRPKAIRTINSNTTLE